MTGIQATIDYIRAHREQSMQSLMQLCSIPSISTLSDHRPDMESAVDWVVERMSAVGLNGVRVLPTGGYPVVYGENLGADGQPTVLIYGHYDVQPDDPIEEWLSPPSDQPFAERICMRAERQITRVRLRVYLQRSRLGHRRVEAYL